MSTQIRIRNVTFAASLPKLAPVIAQENVLGHWQFGASQRSLEDLSPVGSVLTPVGGPIITDLGVKGDDANYYRSDVAETTALTMSVIVRSKPNPGDPASDKYPVSTFSNDPGSEAGGLFLRFVEDDGAGDKLSVRVGIYAGPTGVTGEFLTGTYDLTPLAVHAPKWYFFLMTVDPATDFVHVWAPQVDALAPIISIDCTSQDLSGRKLTDAALATIRWHILGLRDTNQAAGTCEIGEWIVWNRVLTDTEIAEQYDLSRAYFERARGVTLT